MASEEWKAVKGFDGLYEVSSLGRVKRLASTRFAGPAGYAKVAERIGEGYIDSQGYRSINLGRAKKTTVHRLVCEAFHGPPPRGKNQVAHFDGDKLNNRAENLRWANDKENRADSVRLGTTCAGERVWKAKLTAGEVRRIRAEFEQLGIGKAEAVKLIAARRGLGRTHVEAIVARRIWAAL